jgi:dTDP-4-dehydrorhamnose 3,5-epimerase
MRPVKTTLEGPLVLEPSVFGDERGFFLETYRRSSFEIELVQENHSRSGRGIVRGMHFQPGMSKLVRCVRGEIFDVLVDIRNGSPTFGRWEGFRLDDVKHHQVYCPEGFAHGFCVLSDVADVAYGCTTYYNPETEGGFRYDDPDVAIEWPARIELIASARDRTAPMLAELAPSLAFVY